MPNGHGGVPRFGGPIVYALVFGGLVGLSEATRAKLVWVWVAACVLLAALAGWSLTYHLHLWDADEYGGAYTPPEKHRRAVRRYRARRVVYAVIAVGVGLGVVWWRGLP